MGEARHALPAPAPGLTERQVRERELHDRWAAGLAPEELLVEEFFESVTAQENRFVLGYLGPLAGKRILEVGAGAGEASLYFASRGARVTALDISPGQLEVLARAARARGVEVETLVHTAEELPFPAESFDVVYGYGVLHHIDYRRAVPEALRVLKPGGRIAFVEPLAYNPVIWVYRRMAARLRTPDEHPVAWRDMRWILAQMRNSGHREFWLAAQALFVYFWLGERVAPAQERYWKKVLRDGERYRAFVRPLFALDKLLRRIPGLRLLAYNTVLFGERPD